MMLPAITRERCLGVLAFVVAVAFWPDAPNAALVPRWALEFVGLALLLCSFRPSRIDTNPAAIVGLLLLGWASLSLMWAADLLDGSLEILQWELVALPAFWLGTTVKSLRPAYVGLSLGLTVSALLCVAQVLGAHPVSPEVSSPAGLFANRNHLGEIAAVTVVACLMSRLWWFVPGPLLATLLTGERIAIAAIAVAAIAWAWGRNRILALVVVALAAVPASVYVIAQSSPGTSLADREAVWLDTVDGFTIFGHGIGSFFTVWPQHHGNFEETDGRRPDHAHNDLLEITFELGAPGAALAIVFALLCIGLLDTPESFVVVAVLVEGLVAFPLHYPITLMVALLAAGRASAAGALRLSLYDRLRVARHPWVDRGDEELAS